MIGTQLEKMILDGEAVFKTATIGYGNLQALSVPKGKAFVITQIVIQPFANIISDDDRFADSTTFQNSATQDLFGILKRITFQLLMYNQRVNNRWSLRAELQLNEVLDSGAPTTRPTLTFKEKKIDLYTIIEQTTWFYFVFPSFKYPNYQFNQAPLNTIFQNINPFPPAPYGYGTQDTLEFLSTEPGPVFYSTLGLQDDPNIGSNTTPQLNIQNIDNDSTLVLPTPTGIGYKDMLPNWDPSFPLINISYVEINKRTTTNGIY